MITVSVPTREDSDNSVPGVTEFEFWLDTVVIRLKGGRSIRLSIEAFDEVNHSFSLIKSMRTEG